MPEPDPQRSRPSLRPLVAAVVALIPLIPIVIGLTLGGGGRPAGPSRATAAASPFTPVPAPAQVRHARPALKLPSGGGTLVALVQRPTAMRAAPGAHAPVIAQAPTRTPFGSPDGMWVARTSGRWLGVVSTLAGNNRLGWIPASAASLSRVDWELRVSLSARRLTVLEQGRTLERYTIAVGAPASPTPTGRFAVTDRLRTGDPAGPYGCCILALSAVAPHAIQGWSGGNRIAIHSTPETSSIGQDVSHGCMRLTLAEGRWLLAHIPIGTPTLISS